MNKIHLFLAVLFSAVTTLAAQEADSFSFAADSVNFTPTKAYADSAYAAGEYATAVSIYESLLTDCESAVLYFNLGNAYFKSDDMAHAVLNYERALLLNPSSKDIRFNLELARSKTVDRVSEKAELFFVRWFRNMAGLMPLDSWATLAIVLFLIFIASAALFVFARKGAVKKAFFIVGIVTLLLSLCANGVADSQRRLLTHRNHAIVMEPSVVVRSTPSATGTDLFVLHEGRKVTIVDDAMSTWKKIELEDGNVGWIETKAVERI